MIVDALAVPGARDPWLFAATVLVLNATPGVDLMLVLTSTLQRGLRGGVAVALGIVAGCVVHALAAAFGLAALLAASATAFAAVKWAGAAYLAWLAFGMLRAAVAPHALDLPQAPLEAPRGPAFDAGAGRLFRQGLLTNVLNPKVALFFLALLPQFIDAGAPHKTLAFLFLGAWFVLQSLAFLIAFVLLVAPLQRWRPPAALRHALQALGGALFLTLAARLALTPRQ